MNIERFQESQRVRMKRYRDHKRQRGLVYRYFFIPENDVPKVKEFVAGLVAEHLKNQVAKE